MGAVRAFRRPASRAAIGGAHGSTNTGSASTVGATIAATTTALDTANTSAELLLPDAPSATASIHSTKSPTLGEGGDLRISAKEEDVSPAATTTTTTTTTTAAGEGVTSAAAAGHRKPNAFGPRGDLSTLNRVAATFSGARLIAQAAQGPQASHSAQGAQAPSQKPMELMEADEEEEEPTPAQIAVAAVDRKLEKLRTEGGLLRGEEMYRFPHGTAVWSEEGGGGGRGSSGCDVGVHGVGVSARGVTAAGVAEWVNRFEAGSPKTGVGVIAEELMRHLVREGDVGLIGTR